MAVSLVRLPAPDFPIIKWFEMLIDMSRRHCIPAIEFGDGAEMHKPVHLQGFVEGLRSIGQAPCCTPRQLSEVQLNGSYPWSLLAISAARSACRIAKIITASQLIDIAVNCSKRSAAFGSFLVIKPVDSLLNFFLVIVHPTAVNGAIKGGMTGSTLFHELSKKTR